MKSSEIFDKQISDDPSGNEQNNNPADDHEYGNVYQQTAVPKNKTSEQAIKRLVNSHENGDQDDHPRANNSM